MRQRDVINVSPIVQQTTSDCVIAAVAMLLGQSYAAVFRANRVASRAIVQAGARDKMIAVLAGSFGAVLRKVLPSDVDLDADTGLLSLDSTNARQSGHMVVLFRGVIVDPGTGLLWAPEFFLQDRPNLRVEYLLELV